jgi:membrane protein
MAVMAAADEAGGSLLAAGLAFRALFALLPLLLLLAGLSGWFIADAEARAAVVADIVRQIPPLEGPLAETLDRLVRERGAVSVLGLLGSLWGATAFYGSLDEAFGRIFPGGRRRGELERRIRGLVGVTALLAGAIGSIVAGSFWSYAEAVLPAQEVGFWRLFGPAISAASMVAAVWLLYLLVPTAPPSPGAAFLPALVAGIGLAIMTNLFALVAPRLVGGLAAFGVLAALFGALIWLDYGFQLVVNAGAWARLRRDDRRISISGEEAGET